MNNKKIVIIISLWLLAIAYPVFAADNSVCHRGYEIIINYRVPTDCGASFFVSNIFNSNNILSSETKFSDLAKAKDTIDMLIGMNLAKDGKCPEAPKGSGVFLDLDKTKSISQEQGGLFLQAKAISQEGEKITNQRFLLYHPGSVGAGVQPIILASNEGFYFSAQENGYYIDLSNSGFCVKAAADFDGKTVLSEEKCF